MDGMGLLIGYIMILCLQITLLVAGVRMKMRKLWLLLFSVTLISILAAVGLIKFFENLPVTHGMMPGLTYFGEVLFSLGAALVYGAAFLIYVFMFICVASTRRGEHMLYPAKGYKLYIQDTQINYITFGAGTKPLVLIQGLNTRGLKGAGDALAFMYRIFAKDYKVYLFDRRQEVWEGITVRDLAGDIAAAMDELSITKAAVLGVSQGGMIAQYLAIDRPDLVDQLVLAVTLSRNNHIVTSVIRRWVELTGRGDMKQLVTDMAINMYSDRYIKRYRPFLPLLTVLQKPKDTRRFITLAQSCLTCRAYEELDKIQCPVLVIGGKQDKIVGGFASEEIAEKLGCDLYMYEDLGHAAYEEGKDFNRRVYEFLKSQGSAG